LAPGSEEHDCAWRDEAERLAAELAQVQERQQQLEGQLAALQRHIFGQRSEKMPPVAEQLRREKPADPELTQATRRARREARAALPEREVQHLVADERRKCPKCGSTELRPVGEGKRTYLYEYVPARFERQVHVQETLACRCGEGLVVAEPPARVVEKCQYGPGLMAHVVTAKCADSIPLYRQAKALARAGVPINRTTLGDLFHTAADALAPLAARILQRVREDVLVRADETPIRVLAKEKTRRGYVWTFRTERLVAYEYSASRSGETPARVLAGTRGYLLVDAYSGYNAVTLPEGRIRVGCWAHVRRRFFDALSTAPEAQGMLELILDLYRVEHTARDAGVLGQPEHLRLRSEQSAQTLGRIRDWLAAYVPLHPPKSPLGEAIRYTQGQWEALGRFLGNVRLPLDNNSSENALRVVALGRKNFLFVGHDEAGSRLAGLYSLVATCQANGVNPEAYLADVLLRVQSHPAAMIDELLPDRWTPPAPNSS
jgi:transposase